MFIFRSSFARKQAHRRRLRAPQSWTPSCAPRAMATAAKEAHEDDTTVHVEWKRGGAQPPVGVPDDYGDVDWKQAVLAIGPPMIWWNFGF